MCNRFGELMKKELRKRIDKTKADARERVIERGLLQFRLDPELMRQLFEISDEVQVGPSVLARMWFVERLRVESARRRREYDLAQAPLDEMRVTEPHNTFVRTSTPDREPPRRQNRKPKKK